MQKSLDKWMCVGEKIMSYNNPEKLQSFTKEELIKKFKELAEIGWIKGAREGNCGSAGNTLEDLLGIEENNLPIPNAAEWELKTHKLNSTSLLTLLHSEPSPQGMSLVSNMLLPKYGWKHKEAGGKYPETEMSFRQTLNGATFTDRGCKVIINREEKKLEIIFDSSKIDDRHQEWKESVERRVGLGDFPTRPYWGFSDLEHAVGTKLHNCFYVEAATKKESGCEYFWYKKVLMLKTFKFENFLNCILEGTAYIDFDARTGHNHGTKFRVRQNVLPSLYEEVTTVVDIK